MKLEIKPNKPYPVCYVELEVEPGSEKDVNTHMINFYATQRVRKDALHSIKASLHSFADNLTENDLEIL